MKRFNQWFSLRLIGATCGLCLMSASPQDAAALTTDLVATPPDLTQTVSPNLILTLDDSGSMGSDFMPDQRPYDSAGWGNPYKCAGVIDPRITDQANPRSWSMNGVYYNPNNKYELPQKADRTTLAAPTFGAAWDDGIDQNRPNSPASSTARDLSTFKFCGVTGAGYYRLKTSAAITLDANGRIANPTTTLFVSGNWEWVSLTAASAAEKQNFANWYSYYRTRQIAAITSISRAFAPFDENIRVAWQNINSNLISAGTQIFKFKDAAVNTNVRTRFYNFLFATPASGGTPNRSAAKRAGEVFKRATGNTDTNPYWDRDLNRELVCRQNFHIQMTDGLWNGDSGVTTPTKDTDGRTLPDGRVYSTGDAQSKIVWNESAAASSVVTMADIAFSYWATDLRTDLDNKVASYLPDKSTSVFGTPLTTGQDPRDNKEIYWNPKNDPANWQHLVQFMIGFGASGTLPNETAIYNRLRAGTLAWPQVDVGTDDGRKIDDMWHAALNSRGAFFTASDPAALVAAITDIIASIIARRGGSTAIAVSLPILTSDVAGFRAGYDTSDWSGFLTKEGLNPDGTSNGVVAWEAGCKLTGGSCAGGAAPDLSPTQRKIFTYDSVSAPKKGIAFTYTALNATQKAALDINPATGAVDSNGTKRVDYLRGVRTNETTAPLMRARTSLLGAIINSQPLYVSGATGTNNDGRFDSTAPEMAASAQTYQQFQIAMKQRPPTVYAGANDGMMHAFDAVTGRERFAYVPDIMFGNGKLAELTNPGTTQLIPTVDDAPIVRDVFLRGQWRTVLIGTYRLGGRGVYALDVTDPAAFDASSVLWEFTNKMLVDPPASTSSPLGYTYSSANIGRLNNGKWVVAVSTGYFPTSNPDVRGNPDPTSTDANINKTALLIIDLETGNLIRKIDTSSAPQATGVPTWGLSTPAGYDYGGGRGTDELFVAGDLAGNLWRFDVSSANSTDWKVDLMFKTWTTAPTAANPPVQPISVMPVALRDMTRYGLPIWIFGTGKYLGKEDRTATGIPSNVGPQAFYGIRDYGTNSANYPITTGQLTAQTLTQGGGDTRLLTDNPVPDTARGWKIPLNISAEKGERAIVTLLPLYASNRAVLATLIPQGEDPCSPGRRGAFMVIDANNGGVPREEGPVAGGSAPPAGSAVVGKVISDAKVVPISGSPTILGQLGGGTLGIAELPGFQIKDPPYHRGSWRELLDIL
ncbi:MAG TPA: PilC/PilY family type IV pilus protein [Tahibacter sp.]|nr:PilC/PilY family type IV pilus protein [Tahibacter sp.]